MVGWRLWPGCLPPASAYTGAATIQMHPSAAHACTVGWLLHDTTGRSQA